MNRFAVIMAILVVGFGAIIYFNQQEPTETGAPSNHIAGEGTSGVTLIEYADFQCPACGQYFPIVDSVKEIYGDEISFQFRHFPLIGSQPNAMSAHRATEAAGLQGKFYDMHDIIFERQQEWSQASNAAQIFEGYARELELDIERYNADAGSSEVLATINADRARADEQEVTGTPTFFINEERIDNPQDPSEFFRAIDEYIERETGEPSQNSPLNADGEIDPTADNQSSDEPPEGVDLSDFVPTEEQGE